MGEGERILGDTGAQGVERGLRGEGRREGQGEQGDLCAWALSGGREVSWRGGGGRGRAYHRETSSISRGKHLLDTESEQGPGRWPL